MRIYRRAESDRLKFRVSRNERATGENSESVKKFVETIRESRSGITIPIVKERESFGELVRKIEVSRGRERSRKNVLSRAAGINNYIARSLYYYARTRFCVLLLPQPRRGAAPYERRVAPKLISNALNNLIT